MTSRFVKGILMFTLLSTVGCTGWDAKDVGPNSGSSGGPPSNEGPQFEPAGPMTGYFPQRSCDPNWPALGKVATLSDCTAICGDLVPSFTSVSSPSLIVWQCYAPGFLSTLAGTGLTIHANDPVWQVALEELNPSKYWPFQNNPRPSSKSQCPNVLPGGVVTCKFLTNLRIWRVFMCENTRESRIISVEDTNLISRANDANCTVATSINAHGIANTLPTITENPTSANSPLAADVANPTDLMNIHLDWNGTYSKADAAGPITVRIGIFSDTDRLAIDVQGPGQGLDLVYFATLSRVSFTSPTPTTRTAVLNLTNPLIRSNPNSVAIVSGQIRWLQGQRVEFDLSINSGGVVQNYTNIVKGL